MKKLLFLVIPTVFFLTVLKAQIISSPGKKLANKTILPPPPPPPTTNSNTGNQGASVYSLTSVRVNIRTGADNKEFPSEVGFMLLNRGGDGWIMQQLPQNMRNEMKSNSNTEFGLDKMSNPFPQCMTLTSIQKSGLALRIFYLPNLMTDAWKIEGVTITLEFRDQNGNLHPTLGSKTIICNNANGFLNAFDHILMCYVDGQFVPTTSSIQNQ